MRLHLAAAEEIPFIVFCAYLIISHTTFDYCDYNITNYFFHVKIDFGNIPIFLYRNDMLLYILSKIQHLFSDIQSNLFITHVDNL